MGASIYKMLFSSPTPNPVTREIPVHVKCRNAKYPRTQNDRFHVPDECVRWTVPFRGSYEPKSYTCDSIIGKPWADPEKIDDASVWNRVDSSSKIDRRSHEGVYKIEDGVPQNPAGRTGLKGRGILGRWGPNHAADPIVTRWKLKANGENVVDSESKKRILQFIAIQRKDSKEWAIPGGMVDPGEHVSATLRREFGEEALNSLEVGDRELRALQNKIENLFKQGSEVYRGYVDDPRNTDNSWMETVAYNYHDEKGDSVARFKLHAGDDAVGVQWLDINKDLKLYASHADMIRTVAECHGAHW